MAFSPRTSKAVQIAFDALYEQHFGRDEPADAPSLPLLHDAYYAWESPVSLNSVADAAPSEARDRISQTSDADDADPPLIDDDDLLLIVQNDLQSDRRALPATVTTPSPAKSAPVNTPLRRPEIVIEIEVRSFPEKRSAPLEAGSASLPVKRRKKETDYAKEKEEKVFGHSPIADEPSPKFRSRGRLLTLAIKNNAVIQSASSYSTPPLTSSPHDKSPTHTPESPQTRMPRQTTMEKPHNPHPPSPEQNLAARISPDPEPATADSPSPATVQRLTRNSTTRVLRDGRKISSLIEVEPTRSHSRGRGKGRGKGRERGGKGHNDERIPDRLLQEPDLLHLSPPASFQGKGDAAMAPHDRGKGKQVGLVEEEVVCASEVEEEVVCASEVEEEVVCASEVEEEVVCASEVEEEVVRTSEVEEEVVSASKVMEGGGSEDEAEVETSRAAVLSLPRAGGPRIRPDTDSNSEDKRNPAQRWQHHPRRAKQVAGVGALAKLPKPVAKGSRTRNEIVSAKLDGRRTRAMRRDASGEAESVEPEDAESTDSEPLRRTTNSRRIPHEQPTEADCVFPTSSTPAITTTPSNHRRRARLVHLFCRGDRQARAARTEDPIMRRIYLNDIWAYRMRDEVLFLAGKGKGAVIVGSKAKGVAVKNRGGLWLRRNLAKARRWERVERES
ncbi:hypothetical protein BC936DRAFT_148958 [Jimgerdemannia flammicorona]|uniref:Uncharacterized protein n=1 Tax=Jimgerdemannia flammicorona TaxID=994334 RepID=A0A433D1X8_9FUNG|nr:hypothetical protein BC936DRAFT_148958 [Jimgerdemannia flammicorona]